MVFKYEGKVQDDADHQDHEFSDGNPCKIYRITHVKQTNTWYGNILSSSTPNGEFNHEEGMPRNMVEKLRGVMARDLEIKQAEKFRADYPEITKVIAGLIELSNTHPNLPIGQALEHHNDIKAVAAKYLDLPPTLGLPSDDAERYLPQNGGGQTQQQAKPRRTPGMGM